MHKLDIINSPSSADVVAQQAAAGKDADKQSAAKSKLAIGVMLKNYLGETVCMHFMF